MFLTCTIHSISSDGTVTTKFMHAHTHTHYQFLQNCRTLSKQGHCDLTSNLFSLPFTWFIFFCFSLHWYFFFKNGFYEKIFVPLIAYQGFEDFFFFILKIWSSWLCSISTYQFLDSFLLRWGLRWSTVLFYFSNTFLILIWCLYCYRYEPVNKIFLNFLFCWVGWGMSVKGNWRIVFFSLPHILLSLFFSVFFFSQPRKLKIHCHHTRK